MDKVRDESVNRIDGPDYDENGAAPRSTVLAYRAGTSSSLYEPHAEGGNDKNPAPLGCLPRIHNCCVMQACISVVQMRRRHFLVRRMNIKVRVR